MEGKPSNPVLFLLMIFMIISFSNGEIQHLTMYLEYDNARSAIHKTAASIPNSQPKVLWLEMISRDEHPSFAAKNVNPSHIETLKSQLNRDRTRVASLSNRVAQHPSSSAETPVFSGKFISSNSSQYFTRLGVGTPPQPFYMILDTGSDVTWLQCDPCTSCYNQTDPIFDPKESSTYQDVPCGSNTCDLLDYMRGGCDKGNNCPYQMLYGDSSYTTGDLATETVTLGNNISVAGIALGCGHDNEGLFIAAAGTIGLGRGNLSFPNQLAEYQNYRRQFSYCLVSRGSADISIITFGQTPLSNETRFTPMLTNNNLTTFYYVNLTGISVGGSDVQGVNSSISDITPDGMGGVIMDSGTVITRLERSAYMAVRDAFRNNFNLTQTPPPVVFQDFFDTCYDLSGSKDNQVTVPAVVLHFADGADMQLRPDNCLVPVDQSRTFCFAFAPSNGISIIGNIQQQGFGIMFDLETNIIGITPETC